MSVEEGRTLLLSYDDRPDAAADMGVENAQSLDRFRCTKPKVRYPTRQVSADAVHAGRNRSPPVRSPPPPPFRPQPPLRLAGRKDGDFVAAPPPSAAKAEAQELN